MAAELPPHYLRLIRRLIRFAAVFLVVGMFVGILSTEYQKKLRYTSSVTDPPSALDGGEVALPPGLMWEAGFDLRISHGHFILIGGVVPLCVAGALFLVNACGGRPISATLLTVFFWLYAVGAAAALALITYKGLYSMSAVQGEEFDLARVHASMFGGSPVLRALAHAVAHTVLAAGLGVICWALFRSAGTIGAAPSSAG